MSDLYRVYVGWDFEDPDPYDLNLRNLPWREAKDLLLAKARRFIPDDCPVCQEAAMEVVARLEAAEPGTEFEENIDGNDYLLYSESRPIPEPPPRTGQWVQIGYTTDS